MELLHQFQGVLETLPSSTMTTEECSWIGVGAELPPMEKNEMMGSMATGVLAGVLVARDDIF